MASLWNIATNAASVAQLITTATNVIQPTRNQPQERNGPNWTNRPEDPVQLPTTAQQHGFRRVAVSASSLPVRNAIIIIIIITTLEEKRRISGKHLPPKFQCRRLLLPRMLLLRRHFYPVTTTFFLCCSVFFSPPSPLHFGIVIAQLAWNLSKGLSPQLIKEIATTSVSARKEIFGLKNTLL